MLRLLLFFTFLFTFFGLFLFLFLFRITFVVMVLFMFLFFSIYVIYLTCLVLEIRGLDATIGDHHIVDHYEVALGTDRRYPFTRTNIRPFTDVGLNVTWTFQHLYLLPREGVYYVTVRAYGLSSTMVEVTSNGVMVGYNTNATSIGTLELPR